MEKDIYIFSKPLQYFNIRNTNYTERQSKKILIVLDYFIDSKIFKERIKKYDKSWDKVIYLPTKYHARMYLLFHRCVNLYTEIDASFIMGILYKLGRYKNMYIFEEGFGSYRRDRVANAKGLKKWINKKTGVSSQIGFSDFLKGQYLYLPDLYKKRFPGYKKQILDFNKPFVERLREEIPFFMNLSDGLEMFGSVKNKKAIIYLTTKEINIEIIEEILKKKDTVDLLYIKPHPHLRDLSALKKYNLNLIRSNCMVEFLLLLLIDNGNDLTIYHENSTSILWFQNNICSRNVGKYHSEYNIISSYIKEHIL